MNYKKQYVEVRAAFREDGLIIPTEIIWEDGARYEIDRVARLQRAHSRKVGGQGDRYTVIINGQERYLFFERNPDIAGSNIGRWFVESICR
ncbi:MAG: hypothetical protein GX684_00410 [Ruminococcaceae bacterium]|nr:hypothetical protein [Oscillospiraceae bacterium]